MKRILILPDIHGRGFWEDPCQEVEEYDKIIFLGDYVDPYDFEQISVDDTIKNFKKIIEFKKANKDKVILLLGNHCMPYYSDDYYRLLEWHCRHSKRYHQEIHELYNDNKEMFQLAYSSDGILYTHAGVQKLWMKNAIGYNGNDVDYICNKINSLLNTPSGIRWLNCVTHTRGGNDYYGSCIWVDVRDMEYDNKGVISDGSGFKQIFGHTMMAFYDKDHNVKFGNGVEFGNCKMIDTACAYELDVDKFEIRPYIKKDKE